jgi:hypothetical protein
MEEFWTQNPELSFEQVKENTFNKLTRAELKFIEKERKQVLLEAYYKEQREMVGIYLKFPTIMGGVLLFIISFELSFYFENPNNYLVALFAILYVFAVPMLYTFYKNRKIQGKRFLALETVHPWLTLIGVPQLGMCLINPLKEEINQYSTVVLVFCLLWTLGVLYIASATYIQKQSINTIKKQYQLS